MVTPSQPPLCLLTSIRIERETGRWPAYSDAGDNVFFPATPYQLCVHSTASTIVELATPALQPICYTCGCLTKSFLVTSSSLQPFPKYTPAICIHGTHILSTCINTNKNTHTNKDVVVTGVLAFIYLVTGGVAGYYSSEWDEWVDFADEFLDTSHSEYDNLVNIRGAMGAICVSCVL